MKPKVVLINSTPNPIETMCWARRVMHSPVPDTLEELKQDPQKWLGMEFEDYVNDVLLQDGMPTFLEYINLTWKLENVSRALQQQLTRHRIGFSYAIQSMRCIDLPNFADDGAYCNPFPYASEKFEAYHAKMINIQEDYRMALNEGMPTQDARGLLPMNIHSTITFSCSLRAFIAMINKRLCLKTQGEFREVADLMIKEVKKKMDRRILKWIGPTCKVQGYCMMKGENEQQYRENKLSGTQNTQYVCPLFVELFKK